MMPIAAYAVVENKSTSVTIGSNNMVKITH